MSLEAYLKNGVKGGNILFCGAGFSADCLSFNNEELGVSSPFLKALNSHLDYQYIDLQIAADEFIEKFGEHALYELIADRYAVKERSTNIAQILDYPWDRIYTTNYDDVISETLTELKNPHVVINNLERPNDIRQVHANNRTWVVHLHGAMKKWTFDQFSNSCILGRESYLRISETSTWAGVLREDYAAAGCVCFVGFSNSDFYLAQSLYSAETTREKVFFINPPESASDRELIAKQKKFGTPLAIGKEQFSEMVSGTKGIPTVDLGNLSSFKKFQLPHLPEERASVNDQENFIILGRDSYGFHYKDLIENSSSYRARREIQDDVVHFLDTTKSVALVHGGICSGKTTLLQECMMIMRNSGREVYYLQSKFTNLVAEAYKILDNKPLCCLVIDDCFSLHGDLKRIIAKANDSGTNVLLASRTLARDSEKDIQEYLSEDTSFRAYDIELLTDQEKLSLIECTDRLAGWGIQNTSLSAKKRIIEVNGNSRLSGCLLHLFQSDHVRNRFVSELDMIRANNPASETVLIMALYLRHIGETAQENIVAELIGADPVSILRGGAKSGSVSNCFVQYDEESHRLNVISSVNAREALLHFFAPRQITSEVINAIKRLEHVRYGHPYKHIFTQLIRYTQLKGVVQDKQEQNKFFDRLSELHFCRNYVLFWLQWSMAMREQQEYFRAQQYLDEAFGQAKKIQGYDPYQLEDQQAGLWLESVNDTINAADYLKVFRNSIGLAQKLLTREELTSHPYTTLQLIKGFIDKGFGVISPQHVGIYKSGIENLASLVRRHASENHGGYLQISIEKALEQLEESLRILNLKET